MSNIVTDGLVGYWNSKQGVNGSVWENIAPPTVGTLNGTIVGATLNDNGLYFDGIDDVITFNESLGLTNIYSIEAWIKPDAVPSNLGSIVLSESATTGRFSYTKSASKFTFYTRANISSNNAYPPDNLIHVAIVYNKDKFNLKMYVNGVLDSDSTDTRAHSTDPYNLNDWRIGGRVSSSTYNFKGYIACVRFYNKLLSNEEIAQNYSVNTEVGLTVTTPNAYPVVSYLSTSKTKISDEVGINQSIITVQFDKDVTEYVAILNGTDYSTGVIVHQGGAVSANTDAQVIIDWNELSSEGTNRINIYGKGLDGQWTPYSPN